MQKTISNQSAATSAAVPCSAWRCENCKYWKADDEEDEDNSQGICRRYPPTVQPGTWGNYFFLINTKPTEWPEAYAGDWCGEHTPNEKLSDAGPRTPGLG